MFAKWKQWTAAALAASLSLTLAPAALAVTICTQTGCNEEVEVIMTPPSCTAPGSIQYDCPDCGLYTVSTTPAQHKFDVLEDTRKEPTCDMEGSVQKKCAVCGVRETEKAPALGHEVQAAAATAQTCMGPGRRAHYRCTRTGCGKLFSDSAAKLEVTEASLVIPPADHTLTRHAPVDATCTASGQAEYWHCSVCRQDFADSSGASVLPAAEVPALGHKTEKISEVPATCLAAGTAAHHRCLDCGGRFSSAYNREAVPGDGVGAAALMSAQLTLAKLDHDKEEHARKDPSCTEEGSIRYWTCRSAGDDARYASGDNADSAVLTDAQIRLPRTGHDLAHTAAKAATCLAEGNREYWQCRTCESCFCRQDA